MVAVRDDLCKLHFQIHAIDTTVGGSRPISAFMCVVNVDCSKTILGRIVASPLDIGGAENCILFSNFFNVVVRMLEIKFDSSGDLTKRREP